MPRNILGIMAASCFSAGRSAAWPANAAGRQIAVSSHGPLDQYLIADRNAEMPWPAPPPGVHLTRCEVMVSTPRLRNRRERQKRFRVHCVASMGRRSRRSRILESQVALPRVCFNPPAARFNIPITLKRTELVIAGRTKTQMFADITTAFDKKEFPALEPGAMCYMLSKQGNLNDRAGHWRPHLMFFVPLADPTSWGAGSPGSPVVGAFTDAPERHTVFLVPVPSGPMAHPPQSMTTDARSQTTHAQPKRVIPKGSRPTPFLPRSLLRVFCVPDGTAGRTCQP